MQNAFNHINRDKKTSSVKASFSHVKNNIFDRDTLFLIETIEKEIIMIFNDFEKSLETIVKYLCKLNNFFWKQKIFSFVFHTV